MSTGERIKQVRKERLGLTQAELADVLGIQVANVSRWERGVVEPRIKHLRRIATLAKLPVASFYDEEAAA